MQLLTNITANGSLPIQQETERTRRREVHLWANNGTFDSASIQMEASIDGGTRWFSVGTAITAEGYQTFTAPPDAKLRLTTTGIVTAANVDIWWDLI